VRQLADFLGIWRLGRSITHADGTQGQFHGQAQWILEGEAARYHEAGTLQIAGQGAFQAERRYLWDADLNVYFDDGRFFHQVPQTGGEAAHWCDPDHYKVRYAFENWPEWQARWQVRGPRKDYTMTTRYSRA
jgi:hypothetical protein